MAIHVASLALMQFDNVTKTVFTKDGSAISAFTTVKVDTVNLPRTWETQFRVIPDATIPSSSGAPDIKTYLTLEDALGFKLVHIDQSFIITQM